MSQGEPSISPLVPPSYEFVLVEHIDVLIAAIIGFLALLQLPRALARVWKKSEWSQGHFLQYKPRNEQMLEGSSRNDAIPIKQPCSTEPIPSAASVERALTSQPTHPPHIPTYPTFLRPLAEHLRISFVPGYSNLQVIVMLVYLGILLYAFSYRSNFLNNPKRSGILAASQLPFLYAFASKNSVPGSLLGKGYRDLNYFHRYIGCLVVLAVNVHAIGWFYRWTLLGTMSKEFKSTSNRWGLVTLTCMDVIFVFSRPIVRARAYNLFRMTHVVGYIIIIPALYSHHAPALPFIIAVSIVYLLDRILCLLKTRLVTATISPLSTFSATRLVIPSLNHGWRAGQHVRIRVLSTSLGWFGWRQSHPFTIASAPADSDTNLTGEEGLVLICKKAGGWTGKLFDMSKASRPLESGACITHRTVHVLIEGPYGGPEHAMFSSYSAVIMIIGGSGITFALSTIQDLVQKGLRGESRVKVIELVWIVQSPESITPLLPTLTSFMNSCSYLTISVHYTRALTPQMEEKRGASSSSSSLDQLQVDASRYHIAKHPGRPGQRHLVDLMEHAITRATSDDHDAAGNSTQHVSSGMLVGVCGPQGLSKDIVSAVSSIDSKMKTQIGGVEMHLETFGF